MFPDWQRGEVPTLTFAGDYPVAAFEPRVGAQKVGRIFRDSDPNVAADTAPREHLAPGDRANEAIPSGRYDSASGLDRPTNFCGLGTLRDRRPAALLVAEFCGWERHHQQPRLDQRGCCQSEQPAIGGLQFDEFAQSRLHDEL